eukprot:1158110-Pelagomonas_calceolata.AAC.7
MDVDYSPTGREFVAGSYDRSVRIFPHTGTDSNLNLTSCADPLCMTTTSRARHLAGLSHDSFLRPCPLCPLLCPIAWPGGHSREVYTTKRMQRVFTVRFSGDATYVFSGSDDMNVRVWKGGRRTRLTSTFVPRVNA